MVQTNKIKIKDYNEADERIEHSLMINEYLKLLLLLTLYTLKIHTRIYIEKKQTR